MVYTSTDNNYGTAKLIVGTTGKANYLTIATALTDASSGDTIFILPGTYTENLTLKAGVNLTAFECDNSLNATGKVIISGTSTLTTAGTVTISGIQLQTNLAALLAVTGIVASVVNLNNCYLNCTNATGITYSSSSATSGININNCKGNLATTGIGIFTCSSSGRLAMYDCKFTNTGLSLTASTISSSDTILSNCEFDSVFSTSSTGSFVLNRGVIYTPTINTTCMTTAGTGQITFNHCQLISGTASAISVGSGTTVECFGCRIESSNTNAVTGAGTHNIRGSFYTGSSFKTNVTTQTGGCASGLTQGTAPSAGFIGEQIRSYINSASAVSLVTATTKTVTSISLTPGIWDVSISAQFQSGATTIPTLYQISVSPTANSNPNNYGDSDSFLNNNSGGALSTSLQPSLVVPSFRVTLSATTTYYFCAVCSFTVSTMSVYGRISATRVG